MKHREVRIHAEFKGEVSSKNRRWLIRRVARRDTVTLLGILLPLILITWLIMSFEGGWKNWWWFGIFGVCLSFLGAFVTYISFYTQGGQKSLFPTHVVFYADEDHSVLFECPTRRLELYREDIRKVVDMGAYYYLDIPTQSSRGMVCQKDLMICGTEESFVALFEGKIEQNQE